MKVSVFNSITSTNSPIISDANVVLNRIKSGGDQRAFLESIRAMSSEEYKKSKRSLPVICFGGVFSHRNKDSIVSGSGILTLDFDNVSNLEELREELKSKKYVYSVFTSPSARGVKALVRIPITTSDEEYKEYFQAITEVHPTADRSGKDISRACFFSYDPNIYINEDAELWDRKPEKKEVKTPQLDRPSYNIDAKQWKSINTALRKIEDATDGEKHMARSKVAYLFGGWVGAGKIKYEDAIKLLEGAVERNTTDKKSAMQTVTYQLNEGMSKPLDILGEREVLEMNVGVSRMYKPMREVWDDVQHFYRNGYQRGAEIGWKCAYPYMSLLKGSTSLGFASPYAGKSQFFHNVAVNIAMSEGWNFALFTPETGDVAQIYGELISIAAKQTFVGDYKMDEKSMLEHADFIAKHFVVIDNEGKDFMVSDFLIQLEAIDREFNTHIDCSCIDPLNYVDLDLRGHNGREDKALGKDFDLLLSDARKNDRHNAVITHVATQEIRSKDEQMYYPPAHPRQIMGGQQSFRKGMLMWQAYRPVDVEGNPLKNSDGIPYEENETHIIIHKAKPKGVAQTGKFKLYYDFKTNNYYEKDSVNDITPRFANEAHEHSFKLPYKDQDILGHYEEKDNFKL